MEKAVNYEFIPTGPRPLEIELDRSKAPNIVRCFGVTPEQADKVEKATNAIIEKGGDFIDVIEWIRDNMGLNHSQFAGFMFSIGTYNGRLMTDDNSTAWELH